MEDGTNSSHPPIPIQFNFPGGPRPRSRHGIHLMPVGPLYGASSQYTSSSVPSPVSPSRSMSPLDGSLYPDMEIPLPDDPFDALAGMSFQFDEDHTQFPMDGGVDTSPLRVPPVQSRGAGAVDELNVDLDRLASTVQSRLPRHEITQLYEMKDLLRVTFSRLEGMIQHQIDTLDHSPVSPSNGARYLCYLCPPQHRKMYGARGTFRRHVAYRHRPEFIYHCLDDNCLWKSTRRDKVYCHMRTNHRYPWRITREQIALAERRVAAPSVCGLCPNGVSCWADYFKCVSEHCRIQGNSSTSSSASQSRWGSDYRGAGGGFGSYGSQFPDGFGGNGSHSLFSHGTGNAGLGFFAPGQNPGSYGNGYSACVDEVNGPEDRSIQGHSASAADSVSPVSTPYFRASGEPEIASPVPSNLARYHSSLMQGAFPTNHQNIDPVQSNDSRSSQPDESKTDESPRWISRSPNRDRSPKQKPGPEKDQHEKRCESCGHDCDNCNMCHSKETVSQCHMCADMAREAYQEPEHSTTRDWILYENEPPAPTKWDLDSQFLIQADRLGDHRDVTCDLQEQVDPELDKSHRFENTMQKTLNVDSLFSGLPAGLVFNTAITRSVAMKLHASFLQAVYPVLDDTQKTVKIPHDNDLPLTKTRTKTPSETQLQHVTYRVLSIYVPHVEQLFFGQKGPSVSYEADVSHSVSSFCETEGQTDTTESVLTRRYLRFSEHRPGKRHRSVRGVSRKRLSLLRVKLHVVVELLVLRATVTRKRNMGSRRDTSMGSDRPNPPDVDVEPQLASPGPLRPWLTGAVFAREDGLELLFTILACLLVAFAGSRVHLAGENLVE